MSFEVIIPHYSRVALLRRALDALRGQTEPVEVCVVDNGSSDESVTVVSAEYPEVRLIELATNLGFGAACNRGIATSRAEHVVLLNNDAIPDLDFVSELRRTRESHRHADMLSPCLIQPTGLVDSFGIACDNSFNMFDLARGWRPESLLSDDAPRAFAPTGGAAVYTRRSVLAVGGFDERIFAYLEDVDLGLRLWLGGARCAGAPTAKVTHAHSATLGSGSDRKNYLLGRNKAYLIRKYRHLLQPETTARAIATETIVSAGKSLGDRNAGAVVGWASGWRGEVTSVQGTRGALDQVLLRTGFREGLGVRRATRVMTAQAAW
jgi:GT2 family glycosyltransferase